MAAGPNPAKFSSHDWLHIDAQSVPYSSDVQLSLWKTYPRSCVKVLVETEALESADPAVVSSSGLLHLDEREVDPFDFYLTTMAKTCEGDVSALLPSLEQLYEMLLQPALRYYHAAEQTVKVDSKFLIQAVGRLLKPYLVLIKKKEKLEERVQEEWTAKNSLLILRRSQTVITPKHALEERRKETFFARAQEVSGKGDNKKSASSPRKQKMKPRMALEAVFVVALFNSLSNFVVDSVAFSNMLMEILKTMSEDFAASLVKEFATLRVSSLLELTFSIREMSWTPFSSIFAAKPQAKGRPATNRDEDLRRPEKSLSFLENIATRFATPEQIRGELLIPTFSMQHESYWVEFCFRNKIDVVVFGPHQSGKSALTMAVAKELLGHGFSGLIPVNISSHMSCAVVQDLLETSMESRRFREFGGVGGGYFYAVLDDMNLDASNSLYDLFRFWKEAGGWYSPGFAGVSDLTVAFVHSYVEQRSRPVWQRALKHFLLLHKAAYSREELTSIFKQYVESTSMDEDMDGMLSVTEESVKTLVRLYWELSALQSVTEQMWVQSSIANFTKAMKFLAQCDMDDGVDVPQYLRLWTFMFTRFFLDQFGRSTSQVKLLLEKNLRELVGKFTDSETEAEEILHRGVFLPTEEELLDEKPYGQFEVLTEDALDPMIAHFRESRASAAQLYPHRLKHLHKLVFDVERRLAAYLSFYIGTIFDINSACGSVIIRTETQSGLVKALVYMAAHTLNVKVYEFNAEEKEDVFAGSLMETFKSFSPSYFPTEPRYEMKHIMEEATLANKKAVVLFSLHPRAHLDRGLTRRFMEIALDITTGVKLRLVGFTNYYREFVDRFRAGQSSKLYNDEILQVLLTRMKTNVTFLFVVSSGEDSWQRSPLHSIGLLEQFKHEYRTLFNKSRLCDFDAMQVSSALVEVVSANSELLREWSLDYHSSLLRRVGDRLEKAHSSLACDEYTYECVAFCCERLVKTVNARREEKIQSLVRGAAQISMIQEEVVHAQERMEAVKETLEQLEARLERKRQRLRELHATLEAELAHSYDTDLMKDIAARRSQAISEFSQAKDAWEAAVDSASMGPEDLTDAEKLLGHPSCVRVWNYVYTLVTQKTDASEGTLRKFTSQVGKKWKDIAKKLKGCSGDTLPDVALELTDLTPHARTAKATRLLMGLATAALGFKAAWRRFSDASQGLDAEQTSIPAKVAEIRASVEQHAKDAIGHTEEKIQSLENQQRMLSGQVEFVTEKRPDLLDLSQDLQIIKEAWTRVANGMRREKEVPLHDCLLAAFYIQRGLKFPAPQRKFVWKAMSKVLDSSSAEAESLTPLLMADFPQFAFECVRMELSDSSFFMESAAFLRIIVELRLPFPLIYDPYDVAFDYLARLEEPNGAVTGQVTSDSEFMRRFRECVTEGKPVLCHNPSQSLYRAVLPAITWRAQSFLMTLRGLDSSSCTMSFMQRSIEVHPDFRLYICYTEQPPTAIAQQMTEVNFDAEDKESWEGLLIVPLLKMLDDAQYRMYLAKEVQAVHFSVTQREAETTFLSDLLRFSPQEVLSCSTMLETLSSGCHRLEFGKYGQRRTSVLGKKGVIGRRVSSYELDREVLVSPRDKLAKMLGNFYDLKNVLRTLQTALGDFQVSGQALFATILRALSEYIRMIQVPMESQWDMLADSLLFNVFVRIYHSLSHEKRLVLSSFYAILRSYHANELPQEEFLRVLEDLIHLSDSEGTTDDSVAYLRERYPSLFPVSSTPSTVKNFMEKDLIADAKLPDSLASMHKFLLYAYMRPDLLPKYAEKVMQDVAGPRYADIAETDLSIHVKDRATTPLVLLYPRTSPLPYLKALAVLRKVQLVVTQPLLTSVLKSAKQDMCGVGRCSEAVLNCVNAHFGSATWVVVENLNMVSGLEAEVLVKFLLVKMAENVSEVFRVILLFPGRPGDHPEFLKLIQQSLRVVLPEAQSIRDYLGQWLGASDPNFFAAQNDALNRRFWASCALTPIPTICLRTGRRTNTRPSAAAEKPVVTITDLRPRATLGAAFFCASVYLRSLYNSDLATGWSAVECEEVLRDFFEGECSTFRPALQTLLAVLLGSHLSHYSTAAFLALAQQAIGNDRVSVVKPQEGFSRLPTVEYLLQDPRQVALFPSEDHLAVTGLSHSLAREATTEILNAVALLPLTLAESEVRIARDASEDNEKEQVVERLRSVLSQLVKALPETAKATSRQPRKSVNYQQKRPKGWLDKTPQKVKDAKDVDMRNSILDEAPTLEGALEVVRTAEEQRKAALLAAVRRPLTEILHFLSYSRSILSSQDLTTLAEVSQNRVPKKWQRLTPTCAASFSQWERQVTKCFDKQAEGAHLDLSRLLAPHLALRTLLRAFALSRRLQHEQAKQVTPFFTEHVTLPVREAAPVQESMGFLVSLQKDSQPFQVEVSGLLMTASRISDAGVLEDSEQPFELPPLTLTPVELPKNIWKNPAYPSGLKLVLGSETQAWDAAAEVNSMFHKSLGSPLRRERVLVYLPAQVASEESVWLLASSREAQGYWSKRGASLRLVT